MGAPAAGGALLLRLVKEPVCAAGRAYNAAAQRRPLLVGTVTTVVKTSAADLFAQTVGRGEGPAGGAAACRAPVNNGARPCCHARLFVPLPKTPPLPSLGSPPTPGRTRARSKAAVVR